MAIFNKPDKPVAKELVEWLKRNGVTAPVRDVQINLPIDGLITATVEIILTDSAYPGAPKQ